GVWIVGDIAGLPMSGAGGGLLLVVVAAFAVQVVWHRRVRREERWAGALASLAREGLLRLDRDWVGLEAALPRAERTFAEVPPSHPYAGDLGIFGRASLQRLLGPLTSARARQRLTTWLLGP